MSLARFSLVVAASSALLSCSDPPKPTVSGGAVFQLQSPVGGTPTERCNDIGLLFKVAVESTDKDKDGNPVYKLILDNADGASVGCQITSSSFDLKVASTTRGSLEMTGKYDSTTKKGTTTALTIITPGGNAYRTVTDGKHPPCDVNVTDTAEGRFKATFTCPYVFDRKTPDNACSVNSSGAGTTFVQFANCDVL